MNIQISISAASSNMETPFVKTSTRMRRQQNALIRAETTATITETAIRPINAPHLPRLDRYISPPRLQERNKITTPSKTQLESKHVWPTNCEHELDVDLHWLCWRTKLHTLPGSWPGHQWMPWGPPKRYAKLSSKRERTNICNTYLLSHRNYSNRNINFRSPSNAPHRPYSNFYMKYYAPSHNQLPPYPPKQQTRSQNVASVLHS